MTKSDEKKVKALIHSIGLKYNLTDEQVKNIIESPYDFAREILMNLNLENVSTEEELLNKKTNFNFKGLFKLYANYPSFKRRESQKKFINKLNKKQWKKK